ncbi:MAG: DUF6069 family protein [Bacteroidota bacterium]
MKPTLKQALKGATIAAVVAIILNELWDLAGVIFLGFENPTSDFQVRIILSTLIPILIAGGLYFLFEKYTSMGTLIFQVVTLTLALISLYSSFITTWPDGTVVSPDFPVLSIPMHLIAGLSAAFLIPKFSN